jgi:S1-C subfamily serine protease
VQQQLNRFAFITIMLSVGVVAGLALSGRMSWTTPGEAAPVVSSPAPQTRPAAASAAANALPDLSGIAEQALKVSVSIQSTVIQQINDPWMRMFYGNLAQSTPISGSGVIVSADGFILTNRHVVGDARGRVKVTLPDGVEKDAEIIGIDGVSDLAVVKVTAKDLPTLKWGDSSQIRVAQWVLAVGNPFQLSGTVTLGIVSTVNRSGASMGTYADFIQTDAAINPGNSGGALINARGELIGINTMIYSESGGNQGIGFAIPANMAQQVMKELIEKGEIVRGSIGLADGRYVDADTAEENGLGRNAGLVIISLYRNSSALAAGLTRYDLITKVNGQPIKDATQFSRLVYDAKVGSTLKLEVVRRGRKADVDVTVQKATGAR